MRIKVVAAASFIIGKVAHIRGDSHADKIAGSANFRV